MVSDCRVNAWPTCYFDRSREDRGVHECNNGGPKHNWTLNDEPASARKKGKAVGCTADYFLAEGEFGKGEFAVRSQKLGLLYPGMYRSQTSAFTFPRLSDRMRVEAAQQMIHSSTMGLKEIADACGFQTADSMRRTFLRVAGITAGEYMDRFKRSGQLIPSAGEWVGDKSSGDPQTSKRNVG